ncbi:MAG: recombinase family protein, partial [Oscillospiraceae bacterium]|nr:recombinase family protein [Oscillospiraceae bacterium]
SFKVSNGRRAKAEKGEHLCKLAPYGYQKSKTEKNKLIVDEETAPIVRYIYELALGGMPQAEIARRLNSENIDTPLVHRKKKGIHTDRGWTAKGEVNYWTTANVGKILRDIRYAGTMVNYRRTQTAPLSRKTKAVPRDEWVVVPDTHEGIVSMETYEAAQKLLPENGVAPCKVDNLTLFSGKVFCGHCGYALKRMRGKYYYFSCLSQVYISSERCITDRVYEYAVKDAVLSAFKKSAELAMSVKDEIRTANKRSAAVQTDISSRLIKLSGKERQLSEQKAQLFEDFAGGSITRERYIEAKSALAAELDKIKTRKAELESKERSFEPVSETNHVIGLLEKLSDIQEVTPEIASFVKRITIFNSERIEIRFTFADELERMCVFTNITTNDYLEIM